MQPSLRLPASDPAPADVRALLDRLQAAFDAATARIAERCARNGKLDAAKLDQQQWVCYELALASADLLAARTLAASAAPSDLDRRLGLAFVREAVGTVLARLQGIYDAVDLDTGPLDQLATSRDYRSLRHAAGRPEFHADLGGAVAASDLEIGDASLDEQPSMARDAFRRFAAE